MYRGAQARAAPAGIEAELDAEAVMRLDVRDIAAQRRASGEGRLLVSLDVTGQDRLDVATALADVDHAGMAIVTANVAAGQSTSHGDRESTGVARTRLDSLGGVVG